jgi:hypothetical protein
MHADCDRLTILSARVIGCPFTLINTLGVGRLEKVYENALAQASSLHLCLTLNFGKPRLEIKRVVHCL